MTEAVELAFPPSHEYLDLARMVVTTAAALDPMFPDGRVSDLRLAVSEACTNAIEAQQRLERDDSVLVRCSLADDRVSVEVEDRGGGFTVDSIPHLPDATDPERLRHEHGLGIDLIRSVADEVVFEAVDEGTLVRLVVYR
jgi:serine/threonine-protein kinase RsbW